MIQFLTVHLKHVLIFFVGEERGVYSKTSLCECLLYRLHHRLLYFITKISIINNS